MKKHFIIPDQVQSDGVLNVELKNVPHEDRVYRKLTQPTRNLILNRNKELRKNPGSIRDLSFGRQHLSIPLEDYEILKRKYPVLVRGSNAEKTKFYKKFILSTESIPYRVQ